MTRHRKYDRGRWQIERERQRLPAHERPPAPDASTAIGDVVGPVMKTLGLAERFWEHELLEEWPALVGKQVAEHTRPGGFRAGSLTIYVDHSSWLHELQRFSEPALRKNLQKRFGASKIRRLRFQLDPAPPSQDSSTS